MIELQLNYDYFSSNIVNSLQELKNEGIFADATIVCQEQVFKVHKFLLSSSSEYFKQIFKKTPCQHPFIIMNNLDHGLMEALLSFMYRGELIIQQNSLSALLNAANNLKIKGLMESKNCFDHKLSSDTENTKQNELNDINVNEFLQIQMKNSEHTSKTPEICKSSLNKESENNFIDIDDNITECPNKSFLTVRENFSETEDIKIEYQELSDPEVRVNHDESSIHEIPVGTDQGFECLNSVIPKGDMKDRENLPSAEEESDKLIQKFNVESCALKPFENPKLNFLEEKNVVSNRTLYKRKGKRSTLIKYQKALKECPICSKKIKHLASHLKLHNSTKNKIKAICDPKDRLKNKCFQRLRKKCPLKGCENIYPYKLDAHLRNKHKIFPGDPEYQSLSFLRTS